MISIYLIKDKGMENNLSHNLRETQKLIKCKPSVTTQNLFTSL
jgi:hypothetical protein